MRTLLYSLVLLLLPSVAHAALFICGDTTRFRGYTFRDASQPPTCPAPYGLSQVSEANAASQLALIEGTPHYYLKVVGTPPAGLVTLMTSEEQAAVDAAILAKQQEQQAYEDAATNNDLCNATLDALEAAKTVLATNLQGDIDGISNIATAKTELTDMMTRLVNALDKLMRCIRGRAGPPQP